MRSDIRKVKQYLQKRPRLKKLGLVFDKYHDFTMVNREQYIDNLILAERTLGLTGDVIECGVWRGGMIAGIADVLGAEKNYFLFDSFEGLPPVKEIDGAAAKEWQANTESPYYYDNCSAEIALATRAMTMASVRFKCIKGWFEETIPQFGETDSVSLLRLDGDWYDSTMVCLQHLFPKVVQDGIVVIDDYHTWSGCSRAVHDYLASTQSPARIHQSPAGVAYLVKRNDD